MSKPSVVFVKRSVERVVRSLPSLPAAVSRVIEEADRPDASANRLERHIQTDPALTAQVLRVVNSAYYGLAGQVANVGQAIVILGIQQIRNLALSVGAIGALAGRNPHEVEAARRFWRHVAATVVAQRTLCKRVAVPVAELDALRVAALIHDLGRLCIMTSFSELYQIVLQRATEDEIPIEVAELQCLGMTHAEIGRQIAAQWNLPPLLVDLVGRHEGPFAADDSVSLLVLHVADAVSKNQYYKNERILDAEISPVATARLGLDAEFLTFLRETAAESASQAEPEFGMAA